MQRCISGREKDNGLNSQSPVVLRLISVTEQSVMNCYLHSKLLQLVLSHIFVEY